MAQTRGGHPKVEVAMLAATCLHLTVATQTTQHQVPFHPHHTETSTTTSNHPALLAPDTTKARWVKSLSTKPLTEVQISLLANGPNSAIVQLYFPKGECITAMEEACVKLPHPGSRGT